MDVLRFSTAGSVDDGKSTLIGRLMYDTKALRTDQLEAVERTSKRRGHDYLDLSLLTDGLKAEREQGITIDVAHIYFNTPRRKFIITDTPGHVEYTRNMVTGASNTNLAIILIDARHGVVEQTFRHYYIAWLLKIPQIVVAVNKMDLVDYAQERFDEITTEFRKFAGNLSHKGQEISFIPVNALGGDNVVYASEKLAWYEGKTLLEHLETVPIPVTANLTEARFPVQWVIRPQSEAHRDYRGYSGRVAGGSFSKGDEVMVLPSRKTSRIQSIDVLDGTLEQADHGRSVTIRLEDDIDISRGDMLVKPNNLPVISQDIQADLCWMGDEALNPAGRYLLQHAASRTPVKVRQFAYKVDPTTLEKDEEAGELALNEIGRVVLRSAKPLFYDDYGQNRANGAFVLIDEHSNNTVAAGMIAER